MHGTSAGNMGEDRWVVTTLILARGQKSLRADGNG
jgi:hypothetical protein